MGKLIIGIEAQCFAQFRLRMSVVTGVKQIEAEILVRRSLFRIKMNCIAIVIAGGVDMAELCFGNSEQVFNRRVPRISRVSLLKPDQGLIEMPLTDQLHALIQCRRLRVERQGQQS